MSSLDELKKVVSEIETEIGDYEVEIGQNINENTNNIQVIITTIAKMSAL